LFEQVDEAVDFVLGKLDRSVTPGKTGNASDVAYEIPKLVIREAIVNAIAHRDYTSNAGVQVMLFVDRLEVWNPGALPAGMTMKSLRTAHSSVPHNPLISEPLFWARYIERAGTGTLDMIALCRKAGIPEPQFEQRGGQFVLTIRLKKATRQRAQAQVEAQEAQVEAQVELLKWQKDVLSACSTAEKSGKELLLVAGYRNRTGNFKKGIQRLLDHQFIVHTIPDKPNSRLQKYRLTKKGEEYLKGKER
jgi:predicted HTH transcriptional regulator